MLELNRSEIHVQIEFEPQTQEDVARVFVAGYSRITKGAQEDRIDIVAQMRECRVGKRLFALEVVIC
jgi:hypothetical protein